MQHLAAIDRARSKAAKSRFLDAIDWKPPPARWWPREHIAGHVARPGSNILLSQDRQTTGFSCHTLLVMTKPANRREVVRDGIPSANGSQLQHLPPAFNGQDVAPLLQADLAQQDGPVFDLGRELLV